MSARILVVEDDTAIRESVGGALRDQGFVVRAVADGSAFERDVSEFRPDAVVLDWMLPGRQGPTLVRAAAGLSAVPFLMLTARDGLDDRLQGFAAGVDDYLVKPFALEELIARLRVVLRRSGRLAATVEIGDVLIDEAAGIVSRAGRSLSLTATEFRLLCFLATHRGQVLSTTQILTQVWGYDEYADNLVHVHISALRRKLEEHGSRVLHTVRGLGYVLRP